jgi:hypothetical protein
LSLKELRRRSLLYCGQYNRSGSLQTKSFSQTVMRNKYEAMCWKCGKIVKSDDGYFERHKNGWRVQLVACKYKEASMKQLFQDEHPEL